MKKLFVLVFVFTTLIMSILGIRVLINNENKIDNYILHYYSGYYRYDLITKRNRVYIYKKEMVICFKAPCPERLAQSDVAYLKEKYVDFFKNVFNDGTSEKVISKNDISESDYKTLKEIIGINDSLKYKVLSSSNYSTYKTRGYYEINSGLSSNYVIASGESIKGLNIRIIRVEINEKNVILYIKESKNNVNIKNITAPVAVIEFSEKPNKLIVKNIDTGEEFNKIN